MRTRTRLRRFAPAIALTALLCGAAATQASASPVVPDFATPATGSIDICANAAYQAGFRGDALVNAIAIGMAESGCNPTNDGHSGGHTYYGLWQISDEHPEGNPTCGHDPDCNADAAWKYSAGGTNWCAWQSWSGSGCSGTGYDDHYAQFLSQAQAAANNVQTISMGSGNLVNSGIDDVSGDGYADLLWSDGSAVNYLPDSSSTNPGGVPFFGNSAPVVTGLPAGALVAAGAITGHNTADLFIYKPATDDIWLYPGAGGSTPYSGTGYRVAWGLGGNVTKIFAADVSGDGYADLVYTKSDGTAWYLPNNMGSAPGHVPFVGESAVQIVSGLPSDAVVAMGDLNGDHHADMLYTDGGNLYALLNTGSASAPFTGSGQQINDTDGSFSGVTQMTAADLSGDGVADLLWTDAAGDVFYLPNNSSTNPGGAFFYGDSTQVAAFGAGHTLI